MIGVVTAFADSDWHSARLLAELAARGLDTVIIDPASLTLQTTERGLDVLAGARNLAQLDALLIARGMAPDGDADLQFEAYRRLRSLGLPEVNSIDSLLMAQDKAQTSCVLAERGVPTPETFMTQSDREALKALAWFGSAVIKPRFGSLGDGVTRVEDDRTGQRLVLTLLGRDGSIYLQRYVETGGEDFRVFVVGGRARAAIRRRAKPGEWRTNQALGGSLEPLAPRPALAAPAQAAAKAVGLDYTAVDLVVGPGGPLVLEVNGHPNFEGIYLADRTDLAVEIIDRVAQRAAAHRRAQARKLRALRRTFRKEHTREQPRAPTPRIKALAGMTGGVRGEGRRWAEWGDAPTRRSPEETSDAR